MARDGGVGTQRRGDTIGKEEFHVEIIPTKTNKTLGGVTNNDMLDLAVDVA